MTQPLIPYGVTKIKNSNGLTWSPLTNLFVKTNSVTWTHVKTAWVKGDDNHWHRIYPTPVGVISVDTSSIGFTQYYNYHSQPQTITISNTGDAALTITDVVSNNGTTYFAIIDYTGFGGGVPVTIEPGDFTSFSLNTFGRIVGNSTGSIAITTKSDNTEFITTTIPVFANVQPNYNGIYTSPTAITFTYCSLSPTPTANITIYNDGNGGNLTIDNIVTTTNILANNLSTNLIGYDFGTTRNGSATFTVTPNTVTSGSYTEYITINSDARNNTTIIPVTIIATDPTPQQEIYARPGSYNFTVPEFGGTLTTELWGGGAGGTGGYQSYNAGQGNPTTWWGNIIAGGGIVDGAGGTATGGDYNLVGNPGVDQRGGASPNGGQGGTPAAARNNGGVGGFPGAGGGGAFSYVSGGFGSGAGAYAKKTYTRANLTPGTIIPIVVGNGGHGGAAIPNLGEWSGGQGADGQVIINWRQCDKEIGVFTFDIIISVNTANFVLSTAIIAAGWDQVKPVYGTVTVNSDVYVYSSTPASPAFYVDNLFPIGSSITIINNGTIIGAGGNGGGFEGDSSHSYSGGRGGDALTIDSDIILINNGKIAGGGGGGAVGSFTSAHLFGGGGGGAGYVPGHGGSWYSSFYYLQRGADGTADLSTGIFLPGGPGWYGGFGGQLGQSGQASQFNQNPGFNGAGGAPGYAINGTRNATLTNNGPLIGPSIVG